MDGLDVVAVGVEQKRCKVTGMIRALARRSVVAPARFESRAIELLDGFPASRLKREVNAPGELPCRRGRALGRDEELVRPKPVLALAAERNAERAEDRAVKPFAGIEIRHHELHVVDHSPPMKLRNLHGRELKRAHALRHAALLDAKSRLLR